MTVASGGGSTIVELAASRGRPRYGTIKGVTQWEYARLEYAATGSFGADRAMDWTAMFYFPGGHQRWGIDESFDDLRHLNHAGEAGWQVYDRQALVIGQPQRLNALTYSMKRPIA